MKGISAVKYIVILLLSIIGILGISNYATYHKLQGAYNETKDYKFKYSLVKDSLGMTHAKFLDVSRHLTELNAEDGTLVHTTAKTLGIKTSQVKGITQVSSSTTAPISLSLSNPAFKDGHLALNVSKTEDYLKGTYTYTDTCWMTTYTKPKRFLGIKYKTETFGDIHFGNPNTTITGLSHISIDKYIKPKHWVIGPTIGVTYVEKVRPYIGIGVTYSLIRF